jgi:hypothetical protein
MNITVANKVAKFPLTDSSRGYTELLTFHLIMAWAACVY